MALRRRILLALAALFAAVFLAAAGVSGVLLENTVEHRLQAQVDQLARLIDGMPPSTLENSLPYLRRLLGAESLGFSEDGAPGAASFRAPTRHGTLRVDFPQELLSRERGELLRPFLLLGLFGLGLVGVLGVVTARAVARPLERLADQARSLPAGEVRPVGGGAELDHLVDALNRMLQEVRRGERLAVMGRMAAGVAHEIRNPLSSIKMTVQMLRESIPDREACDRVLREIERLELITAELTGASQPLRLERASLARVADEVLDLMGPRLAHLGVAVEKRYAAVHDVAVDGARFKRCLMNLVLNGAQAMPSGGPLVVELEARGGRVRLGVVDAGGGVPEALKDRVFDPFVTTKPDGVGLGLALTKRIVEDHGGAIGFDPLPRGTRFWIELPAHA
jgi:signal transduction histidine kinase